MWQHYIMSATAHSDKDYNYIGLKIVIMITIIIKTIIVTINCDYNHSLAQY